jgi:hypothetical protein
MVSHAGAVSWHNQLSYPLPAAQPISKRGICILGSSERRSSGARENQGGEICARRGEARRGVSQSQSVRALIWTRPAQIRRPQDELESGRRRELLAL